MKNKEPEECGDCPECHSGNMYFPKVENCSCHISAPCGACTSNNLTCDNCGWEFDPPAPEFSYRHEGGGIMGSYTKNPSTELGGGKRIFDYDYNSASGSTMVWRGRCTPEVTAADIFNHFGDGSFGHRGPYVENGRFTFTQITD